MMQRTLIAALSDFQCTQSALFQGGTMFVIATGYSSILVLP